MVFQKPDKTNKNSHAVEKRREKKKEKTGLCRGSLGLSGRFIFLAQFQLSFPMNLSLFSYVPIALSSQRSQLRLNLVAIAQFQVFEKKVTAQFLLFSLKQQSALPSLNNSNYVPFLYLWNRGDLLHTIISFFGLLVSSLPCVPSEKACQPEE